jgi:LysM repeat protein
VAAKLLCVRGKVVVALLVAALAWVGQASAAAPPWAGRYTVRVGDSLTAIAQHYGVSMQALADANGLDWQKTLLIGVILRVPSTGSATNRWAGIYVVRSGDTLSAIAVRYHVSLARLASANGIDPAGVLLIGARLRIASAGGSMLDLANVIQSNPYRHGAVGYDLSYPSCAVRVPAAHEFAIIGLNWGRPFTTNPCFASEWAAAQPPRSVYINTAYSRTLFRHITPDCSAAATSQPLRPAAQHAYAVGCSEAVAALQLLAATPPLAIWLDVEPGNTWSTQRSLNVATIKGLLDHLLTQSPHPIIGVYSNADAWLRIVGAWSSLSVPEWVATGAPDPPGCPRGFAAGPVWLSQTTNGRLDIDTIC